MRKRGEAVPNSDDEFKQLNSINSPFVADNPASAKRTGTNRVWGGKETEDDFPQGKAAEDAWAHAKIDEIAELFWQFQTVGTPETSRAYQDALTDLMRDPRKAYLIIQIGIAAVAFLNHYEDKNDKDNNTKGEDK